MSENAYETVRILAAYKLIFPGVGRLNYSDFGLLFRILDSPFKYMHSCSVSGSSDARENFSP